MKFTFVPEYCFKTFDEASAEFLFDKGIKGIILDIDNTLEPYENDRAGNHVKAWFKTLEEKGIKAAFVSNNGKERVELFNSDFGFPAFYKAKKPFKKNIIRAMNEIGTNRENTILMGDQVFTDVWAAHNAGIHAILLPPINDKRDFLTKIKRKLEVPVIKKYKKKQALKGNNR